jgi:hypothetical protein
VGGLCCTGKGYYYFFLSIFIFSFLIFNLIYMFLLIYYLNIKFADAVVIATPDVQHAVPAIAFMNKGKRGRK